jgi:hypothetical protein
MGERKQRSLGAVIGVVVATTILAVVVGYFIGQATTALNIDSKWGYLATFLLTIPGWYILGVPLNRNVILALVAIVISSVVSAAMGAYAWATIGEMGASAWSIVFPGWALGDITAGSFAIPLMWTIHNEMASRGLNWNTR